MKVFPPAGSPATAAALLAAALLTACTGGDTDGAPDPSATTSPAAPPSTAAPGPTASLTPAPAPTSSGGVMSPGAPSAARIAPPFPADTSVDTGKQSGEQLTVVAVRAARQAGFDRVVFELRGRAAGSPGWRVEYVDRAVQDGSGNEVEVAGAQTLQVFLEGVALPFDSGQEEASRDLVPKDTRSVREVDLSGTFEGRFTAFIGLDRRLPFRVYRLTGPTRIVVEVRDR